MSRTFRVFFRQSNRALPARFACPDGALVSSHDSFYRRRERRRQRHKAKKEIEERLEEFLIEPDDEELLDNFDDFDGFFYFEEDEEPYEHDYLDDDYFPDYNPYYL